MCKDLRFVWLSRTDNYSQARNSEICEKRGGLSVESCLKYGLLLGLSM